MQRAYFFNMFVLIILIFSASTGRAQKLVTTSNADSSLIITNDTRLEDLIKKQKQENLDKHTIPGFRVQIYFGGNRPKAAEVKLEFSSRYPDIPAYLTYQQPNYKVRVGDFTTRFEAQKLLKAIEGKFPTTFVVADEVNLNPIK